MPAVPAEELPEPLVVLLLWVTDPSSLRISPDWPDEPVEVVPVTTVPESDDVSSVSFTSSAGISLTITPVSEEDPSSPV